MPQTEPRVYLKDDQGNYFVQSAGMKEPARIPDDQKGEVDKLIESQDDTGGFIALGTFTLASPTVSGARLTTLGACRGDCGRTFGVQQLAR